MKRERMMMTFFLIVTGVWLYAGPFGLEPGMTLEQIGGDPEHLEGDLYLLKDVPKPHSAFEGYVLRISPDDGLYWIKAIGETIEDNGYGILLQSHFNQLESKLESQYGSLTRYDFLMPGSIWEEAEYWMMSLNRNERVLAARWDAESGANLPEDLDHIFLGAAATSSRNGYVFIEYYLSNYERVNQEKEAAEDGNL